MMRKRKNNAKQEKDLKLCATQHFTAFFLRELVMKCFVNNTHIHLQKGRSLLNESERKARARRGKNAIHAGEEKQVSE
jgi:hypothetical protein